MRCFTSSEASLASRTTSRSAILRRRAFCFPVAPPAEGCRRSAKSTRIDRRGGDLVAVVVTPDENDEADGGQQSALLSLHARSELRARRSNHQGSSCGTSAWRTK